MPAIKASISKGMTINGLITHCSLLLLFTFFPRSHFRSKSCTMAEGRDHFAGSASAIAEVLENFAASPSLCKYSDESDTTGKAKLVRGDLGIEGGHQLLTELHGLQPNLSFTKNQIRAALSLVLKKLIEHSKDTSTKSWAAKLTKQEQTDWLETLQRRIRNMCRIAAQGQLKSPNTAWVKALPWLCKAVAAKSKPKAQTMRKKEPVIDEDAAGEGELEDNENEEEEAEEELEEEEAEQPEPDDADPEDDDVTVVAARLGNPTTVRGASANSASTTTYGFLAELMLPFRQKALSATKEPGLPIQLQDGAADEAPVVGEWPDGEKHAIADCSHGRYKLLTVKKKAASEGSEWETEAKDTKHKIALCQKVDRNLLLIMQEQSRQVCMVQLRVFDDIADEKKSE